MSPEPRTLRAGDWEIALSADGAISRARVRGTEVLHGLIVAVRDDKWETVPGTVEIRSVEMSEHGFTVDLQASHSGGDVSFEWKGTLTGTPQGLTLDFEGVALKGFNSNRIGLVALHPLAWAGRAVTILHADGSTSQSIYPLTVAPSQPFMNVVGFRQATEDGNISIDFEGDVFETEDQRNWSDASYKTYSRPLALPIPVTWQEGDTVHQRVRLGFEPYAASATKSARAESAQSVMTLRLGKPASLPAVGLMVGPDDDLAALSTDIALLSPDFLRVDVVADNELRGADALRDALTVAVHPLQLAIHVGTHPDEALAELRDLLAGARAHLAGVAVFDVTAPATTERSVSAVTRVLGDLIGGIPLIVGTDDNLAELNRNPVSLQRLGASAVTFCLTPGLHDLRSVSMLETPDALGAMVTTARTLAGGPVVLGPLTLRPRRNLYRQGELIDRTGRDASATDERQYTAFAAAWLIATISAAVACGVSALTLFEISGSRGLIVLPGGARSPLFDVIVELGAASRAVCCVIDRPADVAALALADDTGVATTLLLANRTETEQPILLAESGERYVLAPFGIEIIPRDRPTPGEEGTK